MDIDDVGGAVALFSYGTLQDAAVQLANFGRLLGGERDALPGYVLDQLEITDPDVLATSGKTHHPIIRASSDSMDEVVGMVFQITAQELVAADAYEVSDYRRVQVTLKSGRRAFVYVAN